MRKLSNLYRIADKNNISIYNYNMGESGITAASVRFSDTVGIFIDYNKIDTLAEEKMLLSHEIGHCKTGAMYSPDTAFETKERCEYRADKWAVYNLLPFRKLKTAVKKGYTEVWQLAEYFDVTEDFIKTAFKVYQNNGLKFS